VGERVAVDHYHGDGGVTAAVEREFEPLVVAQVELEPGP
jgi:hypothetical protein